MCGRSFVERQVCVSAVVFLFLKHVILIFLEHFQIFLHLVSAPGDISCY